MALWQEARKPFHGGQRCGARPQPYRHDSPFIGVKRHPAFQDLSRDHYIALNRSLQVIRADEGHAQAKPFDVAKVRFIDLWQHDGLRQHFLEEEADLIPVLRENGASGLADRMRREHDVLRAAFAGLPSATPGVAADSARLLTAHARWEENVVFEWLQDHLLPQALHELLARSQAFRQANGLPVEKKTSHSSL
jgi:hypothetical protein